MRSLLRCRQGTLRCVLLVLVYSDVGVLPTVLAQAALLAALAVCFSLSSWPLRLSLSMY